MAVVTAAQQQQTLPSRASRVPRCRPPTSPGSWGLSLPLAGRSLGLEEWGDLPRIWLPLLGAGHRQGCHPCRKAPHILCCSLGRRVSPGPLFLRFSLLCHPAPCSAPLRSPRAAHPGRVVLSLPTCYSGHQNPDGIFPGGALGLEAAAAPPCVPLSDAGSTCTGVVQTGWSG